MRPQIPRMNKAEMRPQNTVPMLASKFRILWSQVGTKMEPSHCDGSRRPSGGGGSAVSGWNTCWWVGGLDQVDTT